MSSRPRRTYVGRRYSPRPPPLDQTRRQSLSGISAHDQSQSPFFKLPIELRHAIYAQVGVGIDVTIHCFTHIIDEDENLPSARVFGKLCTLPQDGSIAYRDRDVDKYCRPCDIKAKQALDNCPRSFSFLDVRPVGTSLSIVPLMQTCRVLYLELSAILYADPTFSFTCIWTLHDFLSSIPTTPHAERIRHLSLTWNMHTRLPSHMCSEIPSTRRAASWRELWSHIGAGSLPALRRVRLELADRIGRYCPRDRLFRRAEVREFWDLDWPVGWCEGEDGEERELEKLWLGWMEPVGAALEGREEVEVQGGFWCKLGEPESLHAVIKGGGGGGGEGRGGRKRRVLVLAESGEEVEW